MIRTMENERQEKLIELGAFCFNGYPAMSFNSVCYASCYDEIRNTMDKLTIARSQMRSEELARIYDNLLREKLLELGCICFSLYVDAKFYNPEIAVYCEYLRLLNSSISEIKEKTNRITYQYNNMYTNNAYPTYGDSGVASVGDAHVPMKAYSYAKDNIHNEPEKLPGTESFAVKSDGLYSPNCRISDIPNGMEPIPTDYIRCRCGYKNRSYAVFCARCGRQL